LALRGLSHFWVTANKDHAEVLRLRYVEGWDCERIDKEVALPSGMDARAIVAGLDSFLAFALLGINPQEKDVCLDYSVFLETLAADEPYVFEPESG
jgi:hypothetical protein